MSDTTSEESSEAPVKGKRAKKPQDVSTLVREWAGATIGIMVVLGAFAGWVLNSSRAYAEEAVRAAVADAGAATARADIATGRVAIAQADLAAHIAEERQARLQVSSDVHELAVDIRELYRVMRPAGAADRSPRLEKPVTDGGGR